MSLGILRIAAVLEKADYTVDLLDLSGVKNYEDVVRDYGTATLIHTFGLTATTPQIPAAEKIQRILRSHIPHSRIILGGPHTTLVHAAYQSEAKRGIMGRAANALQQLQQQYDVLVAGDGELAIFEALGEHPPKIINGDNPQSTMFLTNTLLNDLPFPARHLVDVKSYRYSIDNVPALSLIAQLGCPFGCGFCGGRSSPSLRRIRTRTSENVAKEIIHLYEQYGTRGFMLYDDELNVNPNMVELMTLIAHAQHDRGVEFRLRGFIKAELFTDEQAEAMYHAGFRWLLIGFESGAERILTNIQKKASLHDNTRCLAIAKRHGLKVKALMSVGHPGETEATIQETRDWLRFVKPDDFDSTVITTYPGTPYFDEAEETAPGIWTYTYHPTEDRLHSIAVNYNETADYYKGVPGEYTSYVYTDDLTSGDLVRLRDWLEADVRSFLHIPYPASSTEVHYEHSMGQGTIPDHLLRSTS